MKEEPKKYPIGGYAPGSYSCKCFTCNTMFMGDKRAHQCEPCAIKIDNFFKSFPSKQETLEEAAEEYLMKKYQKGTYLGKLFTAGAEWQAERMYSEEDMIEFGEWCENLQRDNKDIRRNNPDITRKELLEIWKGQFKNKQQ